jgi:putative membrane protein
MKNIFVVGLTLISAVFMLTACGDAGTNTAANRSSNTSVNSGSTMGNAVNSVGNAVSSVANSVTGPMKASPENFVTEAAEGGMAEVEMGKIAVKNAQDAEVKKFGQMMVDDHTKANQELKALATKKSIKVPDDVGSHKSTVEKLSSLKGADFDKEYVNEMVNDHKKDVDEFEKQATTATDPEIKAFAAKTLPVLKKHLEAIMKIQEKMK